MKLFANYEQQIIYCIYIYTVKNDQTTVQVNLFILILYQFIFGITVLAKAVLLQSTVCSNYSICIAFQGKTCKMQAR